jgi:hypothetical protein
MSSLATSSRSTVLYHVRIGQAREQEQPTSAEGTVFNKRKSIRMLDRWTAGCPIYVPVQESEVRTR